MKSSSLPRTVAGLLLSVCLSFKQDVPPRLQLFLLIGQSNMAGRGALDVSPPLTNSRVWMLTKNQIWVPARDPLHFDKPAVVGVGPGLAFARQVANVQPTANIGLIPCAVGGSGIDVWEPDEYYAPTQSYPYDDALRRTNKALENGQLAGILWHQGETDSQSEKAAVYARKLTALINRIRTDLRAENVPFLIGKLGDFYEQKNPNAQQINAILTKMPGVLPHVYTVSAGGLTHKGDTTHFDTPSARTLGRRFADAYLAIPKKHE